MKERCEFMRVFISYSSKEYDKASSLRQVLVANGINCWMAPQSIPSGGDYSQEIPKAIKACDIFLLLLSEAAQASKWVPKELDNAINQGKIIIPFHADASNLNDAFNFMLSNVQRIEAFNRLSDAYKQLVVYIKSIEGETDFSNVIVSNNNGEKRNISPISFNTMPGKSYIVAKEANPEYGVCVKQSDAKVAERYRKAADLGHANESLMSSNTNELPQMKELQKGNGVAQSYSGYLDSGSERSDDESDGYNINHIDEETNDIVDVTRNYNGLRVFIYSKAAQKCATAMINMDFAPLYCCTDNRAAWEIYTIEVDNEGYASFRACNGKYLTVDFDVNSDYPPVNARGSKSDAWEKFRIYKIDSGYAIKAIFNDKWVSCQISSLGKNQLYATRERVDWWETFDIQINGKALTCADIKPGVNMFVNANFSKGTYGWEGFGNVIAPANGTIAVANGTIVANIRNPGREDWHVQLRQGGLILEHGRTYKLSFKARSTVARSIKVDLLDPANGYKWYGGSTFHLTPKAKEYENKFIMNGATNTNMYLMITMGKITEGTPASIIKVSDLLLVKMA